MYGTVAILKPKQGEERNVVESMDRWWRERRPVVRGAISSTLYRNESNPSELIMSVVFDSKEDYQANADDPEQDRWYQQLRSKLESDPRWMDGEVLAHQHT